MASKKKKIPSSKSISWREKKLHMRIEKYSFHEDLITRKRINSISDAINETAVNLKLIKKKHNTEGALFKTGLVLFYTAATFIEWDHRHEDAVYLRRKRKFNSAIIIYDFRAINFYWRKYVSIMTES